MDGLDEICRTCLRRGQPVLSLFDENHESFTGGVPLVEFVNMFTDIMLFRTDGFPEQICTSCVNDVKRAYAFKLRCECSETTLYRLQETNNILNLENFNFDLACTESQNNNELIGDDDDNLKNISKSFCEITNNIIDWLEVETRDDVVDSNLQVELDALLQRDKLVESNLEKLNRTIKEENAQDDVKDNENELVLSCPACPESFRTRDMLKSHIIDYHTDGNVCILCNTEFDCIWSHSDKHLLPRLQCSHCDQKFEYRPLLSAHLRTHMVKNEETGKLEFKCELCPKTFTSHHDYTTHKRTHSEDRPFSCDTCGMSFKRRDKLKAHMTSHSDERPFECTLCQSRFKRKDNLTSHLKSVHQQGDKIHKCTMCEKAFRFRDKLRAHMNTHLRLFSCETCHAGFPRKESLDRHIEHKHRKDGVVQQKSTSSNKSRSSDEKETKSFTCGVCKKEFSLQESLNSHMKTHAKKVELKCELCSKEFTQSNKLKSHMITHTDLRPFQCTFCSSVFKRKDNLNRHMKKHNRNKGTTPSEFISDIKPEIQAQPDNDHSDNKDANNATELSQLNSCSEIDSVRKENSENIVYSADKSFAVLKNVQSDYHGIARDSPYVSTVTTTFSKSISHKDDSSFEVSHTSNESVKHDSDQICVFKYTPTDNDDSTNLKPDSTVESSGEVASNRTCDNPRKSTSQSGDQVASSGNNAKNSATANQCELNGTSISTINATLSGAFNVSGLLARNQNKPGKNQIDCYSKDPKTSISVVTTNPDECPKSNLKNLTILNGTDNSTFMVRSETGVKNSIESDSILIDSKSLDNFSEISRNDSIITTESM